MTTLYLEAFSLKEYIVVNYFTENCFLQPFVEAVACDVWDVLELFDSSVTILIVASSFISFFLVVSLNHIVFFPLRAGFCFRFEHNKSYRDDIS